MLEHECVKIFLKKRTYSLVSCKLGAIPQLYLCVELQHVICLLITLTAALAHSLLDRLVLERVPRLLLSLFLLPPQFSHYCPIC